MICRVLEMKFNLISKYVAIGAVTGYFVIHPLVMILSHTMFEGMFYYTCTLWEFLLAELWGAFSLNMLLWGLSTATFCGIIGYFYGKVKSNEQALQIVNMTKDKFFSILAHDLKTPLVNLVGASDLLLEKYDSFDDEKKKRYVKNISQSSHRLYDLVEDLLTWSRAQTGKLVLNPSPTDLKEIVAESIAVLKVQADEKHIILYPIIAESTMIYVDVGMVMTVLRNLVSNALKFTPEGGKVEICSQNAGLYEEITVADTGVGIPPADQPKLFKLDSGYSTPGTAGEQGTGLGLVLCKEFIEKHGGSIRVESKEGKGSQFIFTLPRA